MDTSSPLCCCRPKNEYSNPVFRQQYITQSGKAKLTMPLSPMHYLAHANGYMHDRWYPPRWENAMPTYEYQVPSNDLIKQPYDLDKINARKAVTPTMSFVTQPKRQVSSHYILPNPEYRESNIEMILASINEKLLDITKRLVEMDVKVSGLEEWHARMMNLDGLQNKCQDGLKVSMDYSLPGRPSATIIHESKGKESGLMGQRHDPERMGEDVKMVKGKTLHAKMVGSERNAPMFLMGDRNVPMVSSKDGLSKGGEALNVSSKGGDALKISSGPDALNGLNVSHKNEELALLLGENGPDVSSKSENLLAAIEERFRALIGGAKGVAEHGGSPMARDESLALTNGVSLPITNDAVIQWRQNEHSMEDGMGKDGVMDGQNIMVDGQNVVTDGHDINVTREEYLSRLRCELVQGSTTFETVEDSICGMNTMGMLE